MTLTVLGAQCAVRRGACRVLLREEVFSNAFALQGLPHLRYCNVSHHVKRCFCVCGWSSRARVAFGPFKVSC